MKAAIHVLHIRWFSESPLTDTSGNPVYPSEVAGMVSYQIRRRSPDGEDHFDYLNQPFMLAPAGQKNYLIIRGRKEPIWSWDGNRVVPSLTPSYETRLQAYGGLPTLHVHLHLLEGRIVVSEDAPDVVAE
jgi:hypothetical protein